MQEKHFNLLREPWILVGQGAEREELSLGELFPKAHLVKGLSGEMEAQNLAVLRLLLAVLYAVFVRETADGRHEPVRSQKDARERWTSLWNRGSFPGGVIQAYLDRFEEWFWLFHPSRPFFQVPFREEKVQVRENCYIKPTLKPLDSLIGEISESGHKKRLFRSRYGQDGIPCSEAARWLLYLNAFDSAPAGAPGNEETGIAVKGYGVGWLGKIGPVWVNGNNLFETLMLNMVMYPKENPWETCSPEWEKEDSLKPSALLQIEPPFPGDLCALYTMQFRRIHLLSDGASDLVTGYQLWSGQTLDPANAFLEPMTAWRKKDKGYVPRQHDPSRQMWRDFPAFLPAAPGGDNEEAPGVIKWLSELSRSSNLTLPPLRLGIAGITYTNNTAVDQVFSDALTLNSGLLTELGWTWNIRIREMLRETDRLAVHLVDLERSLRKAAGDDDQPRKMMGSVERAFFALDEPFRVWLESVRPEEDGFVEKCDEWLDTARRIIRGVGEKMVQEAGTAALVGRTLQEDVKVENSLQQQIMKFIESGWVIKNPGSGNKKRAVRYTGAEAFGRFLSRTSKKNDQTRRKEE